jgi:phenylacetate-coenzyme A ligase PaaK-like adenylate-forming protein
MPFVRSVTGDVAMATDTVCGCGSPLPAIARLDGRTTDMLFRADGSMLAGVMLSDVFLDLPAVTHAQFVQDDRQSLDINAVAEAGGSSALAEAMAAEMRALMGPGVDVRVHFVDAIPRNPRSGKYQEVICRVPRPAAAQRVARC